MWEIWQAPETVLKTSQISSLTPTVAFYLSELAFKFLQRYNSWSDKKNNINWGITKAAQANEQSLF